MEEEIWKPVVDFPNYEVSNQGRVRNIKTKHVLKPQINNRSGYYHIGFNINGNHKNIYVHKMVAEAFLGKRPDGYDINHIDGNKLNNKIDNLEYCTRSSNILHSYKNGLNSFMIPILIVETNEKFDSINECARAIDGDPELIRQCINDKYSRKTHKGYHFEAVGISDTGRRKIQVKILETNEVFDSLRECERAINGSHTEILKAANTGRTYKGLHFKILKDSCESKKQQSFLYPHQQQAVERMFDGCILNGGVGSGKSRAGLYYYFKEFGGQMNPDYIPMKNPPDLYIITTAKKRNDLEWEGELCHFLLSIHDDVNYYDNKIVVDSWQNIKKYTDVEDAFFIFDEDHVTGNGAWVKAFYKIAKNNRWIILSATAGDKWEDYIPIFVANGFYKNKTEFTREHIQYARYSKYPKVERYYNTGRLIRLRNKILIDMDFKRHTTPHHIDIYCDYDTAKYKEVMKTRWDPFRNEPIQQASGLCYVLRRIVNTSDSRQVKLLEIMEKTPRAIIFYNFDHERDILLSLPYGEDVEIAEWSGHAHEPVPDSKRWVYIVQYTAGCEGFNCIKTDTIIFYSQNYSYKTMIQAAGRIDRLNTPYSDLYYYHFKSRSSIDIAISKALKEKKTFNETRFVSGKK